MVGHHDELWQSMDFYVLMESTEEIVRFISYRLLLRICGEFACIGNWECRDSFLSIAPLSILMEALTHCTGC